MELRELVEKAVAEYLSKVSEYLDGKTGEIAELRISVTLSDGREFSGSMDEDGHSFGGKI